MLQQTTVAAVVPYFERFLRRFPTIERLAAADQTDVLRCWEGLGYYSRARNIHRTARQVVAEHGGRFPASVDELVRLPGIGRYTAGAIASFAFDQRAPIVEANTLRLYSRLLGYRGDPRSAIGQKLLWDFAEHLLPRRNPGRFNQALMELGATLCRQREPLCSRCPLRSCCRAFAEGTQHEVPPVAVRPAPTAVTEASVAVFRGRRCLLRRRRDGERWAGLWDFLRFELNGQTPATSRLTAALRRKVQSRLLAESGLEAELTGKVADLVHSVTRYRVRLLCFVADYRGGAPERAGQTVWVRPADLDRYPLSVTARKFAQILQTAGPAVREPKAR